MASILHLCKRGKKVSVFIILDWSAFLLSAYCYGTQYIYHIAGVAWTEEEHKMFEIGLEKLGKGDWRGISSKFVTTRTPTQVASHAQKYFLRQNNTLIRKRQRRPSLFDDVRS